MGAAVSHEESLTNSIGGEASHAGSPSRLERTDRVRANPDRQGRPVMTHEPLTAPPRLLVTGGLGFVGSAVAVEALEAGGDVVVLDDLSAGKTSVLDRIEQITGRRPRLVVGDVRDSAALDAALSGEVDAVVHCAGLKSVEQSLRDPLTYYDVNVTGTLRVLEAMRRHGTGHIVFSSSATVYGPPAALPIPETAPTGIGLTNPYGTTKHVAEGLLRDAAAADPALAVTILRYFNPIGAHPSGLLGEDPASEPTNVFPRIAEVARGERDGLVITGDDYPTPDGTGVRDYLHITDLAAGHLAALRTDTPGCRVYNLGTGAGTSVRALVDAYARACGNPIPVTAGPRRPGDIAACYADATRAARELGWRATLTVDDACAHSWAWQRALETASVPSA